MGREYNGHKNKAYWNVALYINNDEGLYRLAQEMHAKEPNRAKAAKLFVDRLRGEGVKRTPDGYKFTYANVTAGLSGVWEK